MGGAALVVPALKLLASVRPTIDGPWWWIPTRRWVAPSTRSANHVSRLRLTHWSWRRPSSMKNPPGAIRAGLF